MSTTMTPSLLDAQRYVGMAYVAGEFDCADLVALVQRELFGKALHLPPHGQRPQGRAGRRRLIGKLSAELGQELDAPAHGAVILMQQSDPDGAGMVWHLGVLFADGDAWWVLHNVPILGGVWLHRMADLGRMGLQVEGYYACA